MSPKTKAITWLWFTGCGILAQASGLVTFALVSRTGWGAIGKPIALAVTFAAVILLIWRLLKSTKSILSAFVAAVCLSLGYIVAFHLTVALFLTGLPNGFASPGYFLSVLRVFVVVLAFYVICSAAAFTAQKLGLGRSHDQAAR